MAPCERGFSRAKWHVKQWLGCLSVPVAMEYIVPKAILFDLDETLTDCVRSVAHYAERFHHDFTTHLASTAVSSIAAAILTADVRANGNHSRGETSHVDKML